MDNRNPIKDLVEQLSKLPGIGPKSAQRLSFFFLSLKKSKVLEFAEVLVDTREKIKYCDRCFNISFFNRCYICLDQDRFADKLCVVSEPKDIVALERTGQFKGHYHVLGGLISPIDGIHPEGLRIWELEERIRKDKVSEIIFALNPTIEGDATLLYLNKLLRHHHLNMSKLAHGLPMGADIDYTDEMTLQKAFMGRTSIS
ncbi:MAG: recombination protein RecR [bacterium]|nr:recombination protein RecR [bacterium]